MTDQNTQSKVEYIERTIRRLGVCSISTDKLTTDELEILKERFIVEQAMGYTKFRALS